MTQRRTSRVRRTMSDRDAAQEKNDKVGDDKDQGRLPKGHPQDVKYALVMFLEALTDLAHTINEAVIREGDNK
jgi:hypothetical protein